MGAEADCTEAIRLNPYVPVIYELRGLCRIKQNNFSGAIADYDKTIEYEPDNKNLWYNRVLCKLEDKDYDKASADLDVMMRRWPKYSQAFRLKAELCLQQKTLCKEASIWTRAWNSTHTTVRHGRHAR